MKKILIIAGALHIGGAERVAANLSLYSPKEEFAFDYLVFDGYENFYGPEIEKRGGKVISVPSPGKGYLRYFRTLSVLIRENRYCAVHSHTQFNSGLNLAVAKLCGVPIRIAHSHTTKTERRVSLFQKAYEEVMRILLRGTATHFLACGEDAGVWMFGRKAFSKRGIVIKNGIDVSAFAYSSENREKIRSEFGIATDAFVIGHSGTLIPLKNQEFLIRLLPGIRERLPGAVLMLLGAGDAKEKGRLQSIVSSLNLNEAVLFCGGVGNVNEYLSAMDVFAFPSLREGTPLALLEAQANGLPCIVSDRIPKDAFLTDLIKPTALDNKGEWIDRICKGKREMPCSYKGVVSKLGYDCASSYSPVYDIYRSIATVSLSFDDGRGDNTEVVDNLLIPNNIPATLNITTGYVDGTCPKEMSPSEKKPMTVDEVCRLSSSDLIEIAMHGDRHQNTEEDIERCKDKLKAWLTPKVCSDLGFASPGSGLELSLFLSQKGESIRRSMSYLRTSFRISSFAPIRVLSRKAGRVIHLPLLYRIAYHDTIMTEEEGQIMYSIPVMKDATVPQVLAVVKDCVRRRGAVVLMLHSILDDVPGEDNWAWKKNKLEVLCKELVRLEKDGKLSLCTTIEQYRLLQRKK